MFNATQVLPPLNSASPQGLDEIWKSWAISEEVTRYDPFLHWQDFYQHSSTRTVSGLYIHDAQLAIIFHHDPILRHNAIRFTVTASNEVFAVPNASQWA